MSPTSDPRVAAGLKHQAHKEQIVADGVRIREAERYGNPSELARMRDTIARAFGVSVDQRRLEAEESVELLALHKKAIKHEGWETSGGRLYLLTRLEKGEQARWRELVSKAAGRPGLLDDLDEDGRMAAKIAAIVRRASTPAPSSMAAPKGSAVLPAGVLEDVIAGKLVGLDVAVLGVVVAMFAAGKLHPHVQERRYAEWEGDGETLLIRGSGLPRLLPAWDTADGLEVNRGGDRITFARDKIAKRLTDAGWLEIDRVGRDELRVRLGERLTADVKA